MKNPLGTELQEIVDRPTKSQRKFFECAHNVVRFIKMRNSSIVQNPIMDSPIRLQLASRNSNPFPEGLSLSKEDVGEESKENVVPSAERVGGIYGRSSATANVALYPIPDLKLPTNDSQLEDDGPLQAQINTSLAESDTNNSHLMIAEQLIDSILEKHIEISENNSTESEHMFSLLHSISVQEKMADVTPDEGSVSLTEEPLPEPPKSLLEETDELQAQNNFVACYTITEDFSDGTELVHRASRAKEPEQEPHHRGDEIWQEPAAEIPKSGGVMGLVLICLLVVFVLCGVYLGLAYHLKWSPFTKTVTEHHFKLGFFNFPVPI
ncbi:hypothetical protein Ciccas_006095 [Cichlidogyrus casuarinus]|uniref:Uncharacterized protein n=1 Tax=Cichlidogyrus casuarinus TaxID=1844966 RepID=A0ABD2Q7S7_9PLAT